MYRIALIVASALLCAVSPALAQTFLDCADIDEDGSLNVGDAVMMIDEHRGGPPLPAGKGDIDFRQGYTAGDLRYLLGYIFFGYPEGGCGVFPPYPLVTTSDSLFLPTSSVAAGSGELSLPIIFTNREPVTDLVLPLAITGMDASMTFDSLVFGQEIKDLTAIAITWADDSTGGLALATLPTALEPGVHVLATAYLHFAAGPGGSIAFDTTTPRPRTFLNYVYGGTYRQPYESLTVAVPTVVVTTGGGYPTLSVDPDTLLFQSFAGYPDPDPQSFKVETDGALFNWFLYVPERLDVDKTSGNAGEFVAVTPRIGGLPPGTHYYDIEVYSTGALGSPVTLTVAVELKQQFPSLDANCDGTFNLTDVIVQINYMFRDGVEPCNPCTGEGAGP
jgi:hypothetical protein